MDNNSEPKDASRFPLTADFDDPEVLEGDARVPGRNECRCGFKGFPCEHCGERVEHSKTCIKYAPAKDFSTQSERQVDSEVEDYRNAPSGEGPHAFTWNDKPHRLLYDLCDKLDSLKAERDALTSLCESHRRLALPAPTASVRVHCTTERETRRRVRMSEVTL